MFASLVTWLEKVHCGIFGHDPFDDPRFSYAWCVKCNRKWHRPQPLTGEFYD